MRLLLRSGFLLVLTVGAGNYAGCDPLGPYCTREDVDAPCAQGTTAEWIEEFETWRVILRTTVTRRVEYDDDGKVCSYRSTSCVEEECLIANYWGEISEDEAIAQCRDEYNR